MFFYYRKRKHRKHKNRKPWKSEENKRCYLSKKEYDDFTLKIITKDSRTVVISIK